MSCMSDLLFSDDFLPLHFSVATTPGLHQSGVRAKAHYDLDDCGSDDH